MINFELDPEQKEIIELAKNFAIKVLGPAETELDKITDPKDVFQNEMFKNAMQSAYELGFHKMNLPEACGGLGLNSITIGHVWEEIAYHAPGFAATLMSAGTVPSVVLFLSAHNKKLVEQFVVPYCLDKTGTQVTAWGSSEPNVGSDGCNYYDTNIRHHTTATKTPNGFKLSGTKSDFISNGGIANNYLIFACVTPELGIRGSGTFLVPRNTPGVSTGRTLDKIGLRTLNQSAMFMQDVEIPEEFMIFPPGDGFVMLHNAIHTIGNLGVASLATGIMRAAYESALHYSKERMQGGKPLFKQQLVAKELFDAYSQMEAVRSLVLRARWESVKSFPGNLKLSLASKVLATKTAIQITNKMQEIFGGYGISKEYKIEKILRDATLLQNMDGANGILSLKGAALL